MVDNHFEINNHHVVSATRRGIILWEANPMSGVLRTMDPVPPHPPASVLPFAFAAWGGHTRWVDRGVGGQ
jgi:hypothetical protein